MSTQVPQSIIPPNLSPLKNTILRNIIGAVIALIGNALQGSGFVIQKYAHNKIKKYNETHKTKESYVTSKTWLIGLVTVILGSIVNSVALNFAPQSICLPLSTTTLLVNAILSILILNEPWNVFDVIAIIIIISGTVVTVRFGPIGATPIKTMDELKSRFRDKSFLITLGWFTLVSLAAYLYCKLILILNVLNIKRVNKEYGKDKGTAKPGTDSINSEPLPKLKRMGGKSAREIKKERFDPAKLKTYLIAIVYVTAYWGAINMLILKCWLTTMNVIHMPATMKEWMFWATFVIFIATLILLEYWRQESLKLFNSLYVIPMFQTLLIVSGTWIGGVFFEEFVDLDPRNFDIFCVGIGITIFGVLVLTFSNYLSKLKKGSYVKLTELRRLKGVDATLPTSKPGVPNKKTPQAGAATDDSNVNNYTDDPPFLTIGASLRILSRHLSTRNDPDDDDDIKNDEIQPINSPLSNGNGRLHVIRQYSIDESKSDDEIRIDIKSHNKARNSAKINDNNEINPGNSELTPIISNKTTNNDNITTDINGEQQHT